MKKPIFKICTDGNIFRIIIYYPRKFLFFKWTYECWYYSFGVIQEYTTQEQAQLEIDKLEKLRSDDQRVWKELL